MPHNNSTACGGTEVVVDHLLSDFHTYFMGIFGTMIVVFGVLFNLVAMYVFTRPNMNVAFTCYITALTASDTIYAVCLWLNQCLHPLLYTQLQNVEVPPSAVRARFFSYPPMRIFYTCSTWYVVVISIERYFAICFPFREVALHRKGVAKVITVAVLATAVVANVPAFFEFALTPANTSNPSDSLRTWPTAYREQISVYYIVMRLLTHFLGPIALIGTLNTLVAREIHVLRKLRAELTLTRQRQTDLRHGVMFLFYGLMFVVCHSLPMIHYIMETFWQTWYVYCHQVTYLKLKDIGHIFLLLNVAASFWVYYLCGTKFRQAVHREMCGCLHKSLRGRLDSFDAQRITITVDGQRTTSYIFPSSHRCSCAELSMVDRRASSVSVSSIARIEMQRI